MTLGNSGADTLSRGDGNDAFGQDGKVVPKGGGGADELNGGNGADRLFGRNGADTIFSGDGNDELPGTTVTTRSWPVGAGAGALAIAVLRVTSVGLDWLAASRAWPTESGGAANCDTGKMQNG
jgi:Ca2+-binding RTX toxin-like protein